MPLQPTEKYEMVNQKGLDLSLDDHKISQLFYFQNCEDGQVILCKKGGKFILENCKNMTFIIKAPLMTGTCELINCERINFVIHYTIQTMTLDFCKNTMITMNRNEEFEEEKTKTAHERSNFEFAIYTCGTTSTSVSENQISQNIEEPSDLEAQYITRFFDGKFVTEQIIRENGYQITRRERDVAEARADRDSIKMAQALKSSVKISKAEKKVPENQGKLLGETQQTINSPKSFFSGITTFSQASLKPTTTIVKGGIAVQVEDRSKDEEKKKLEEEIKEFFEEPEEILAKVKILAKMILESESTVVYTGAGVSASTGISTYRGPNGLWTRRDQGLPPPSSTPFEKAIPTTCHMSLVTLLREKKISHVVSTNVDGLHRRSGLSESELSELHGNCYKENCKKCNKEYLRDKDTTPNGTRRDHLTGRNCECGGPLVDNIVNFGESLPEHEFNKAISYSKDATLALVLGTSMKVSPACNLPEAVYKKPNGKLVIVNLQRTPYDKYAHLRIFGESDMVMAMLMEELNIKILEYKQ